ncbi:MAG: DUF362 domain-containing protein [Bryobacterales bacterium]|nr:DUF362 domain-containing protein [Bryobacterales bacterium]
MAPPDEPLGRRNALARLARAGAASAFAAGAGVWLAGRSRRPEEPPAAAVKLEHTVPEDPALPVLAVVQGEDPRELLRRAVDELGGIRRFVSPGDVVVVKPNASWDRTPEQAANTNPFVVAEMVRLCREAGAKSVVVSDVSINDPRRSFQRSGIGAAALREGAEVVLPEERRFRRVDLRGGLLREWPVLEPFLTADKIINLPVAKHHSLTGVTLGLKSWYGILGGQRQRLHQRIHESLADLGAFLRPTLTVIDGYRVLLRGGPSGGNLEDVVLAKTLLAGTDPVALDACAAKRWWDLDVTELLYLRLAAGRGLGNPSYEALRTVSVTL